MRAEPTGYVQKHAPWHWRASASGVVLEHLLIAERVLGRRLPDGAEVHHVDGNRRNNNHANLVICQDHTYHMLLHVRASVLKAGGDPNSEKLCSRCKKSLPFSAFNFRKMRKASQHQCACRDCQKLYYAEYRQRQQKSGAA